MDLIHAEAKNNPPSPLNKKEKITITQTTGQISTKSNSIHLLKEGIKFILPRWEITEKIDESTSGAIFYSIWNKADKGKDKTIKLGFYIWKVMIVLLHQRGTKAK